MRGLDPRIHQSSQDAFSKGMDCRVKPGNDGPATFSTVVARLDRAIQYSEASVMESKGRGILDTPHARGMTTSRVARMRACRRIKSEQFATSIVATMRQPRAPSAL
jgi:hypothetical protein